MNIFLLSFSHLAREFFDAVDSTRQLPLIFEWRFQGLQWRFLVRCWRSFHWRFHGSTMTLFCLLISFVNRELGCAVYSIRQPWISFKDDFSFYSDSVFATDFRITNGILCLTIPCVKHEYIFAIGFSPRSWILWRCRPHTSAATHITVAISRSTLTLF